MSNMISIGMLVSKYSTSKEMNLRLLLCSNFFFSLNRLTKSINLLLKKLNKLQVDFQTCAMNSDSVNKCFLVLSKDLGLDTKISLDPQSTKKQNIFTPLGIEK